MVLSSTITQESKSQSHFSRVEYDLYADAFSIGICQGKIQTDSAPSLRGQSTCLGWAAMEPALISLFRGPLGYRQATSSQGAFPSSRSDASIIYRESSREGVGGGGVKIRKKVGRT